MITHVATDCYAVENKGRPVISTAGRNPLLLGATDPEGDS
jgi:hypothetical protein